MSLSSPAEQERIGREIAAARAAGTCWKLLERDFGYSRMHLWRLLRRVQPLGSKDVTCYTTAVAKDKPEAA